MHTLPTAIIQLLAPFAPLFYKRVWPHVRVLLVGAILALGKRTVSAALAGVLGSFASALHQESARAQTS
jgi:hypothetical protein